LFLIVVMLSFSLCTDAINLSEKEKLGVIWPAAETI